MAINDKQQCHTCEQDRPLEDFTRHGGCIDGYQWKCRTCKSARSKEMYQSRPEKREKHIRSTINSRMKREYNITLEDYERMYEEQGGKCNICGGVQSGNKRRLDIDHNHSTGKVRALLCSTCNLAVGMVENNDIGAILQYIERYDYGYQR